MSATPTLVIDARMVHASGIGVYLQNIIPFLWHAFDLTLLGNPNELQRVFQSERVRIVPATAPIYSIKEQLELRHIIPRSDLFWSPHYNIPLLPIAAHSRVVTIHDVYHLAYQHTLTLPQKIYANTLIRAATRMSAKVITVSDFSKREIEKYSEIAPGKVITVYNGVNTERFSDKGSAAGKPQQDGTPYILFVGNVKPHKNLVTLLKAFAHLLGQGINLELRIVGKKEGFITGETQVESVLAGNAALQESVTFTGYVDDASLPELYRNASVLAFPSLYEGFGLPPLEAMASGCPVVASTAASIPEVCGDAALFFDPQDHLALAEKLKEVLHSSTIRKELISKGYRKSAAYTWQAAAARHIEVFQQILTRS